MVSNSKIQYALDIVGLSKRFRRQTTRSSYTTFKSGLLSLLRGSSSPEIQYTDAIKDLTLRVPKGAAVGVIGRNGSGKSTLLKLITGIYKPSSGTVSVNGRVAALIELGAGFHPDFTGRENIFLGGVVQGLSKKEIEERFDQIVEFAELKDVIDDPVRTYSSGMYMRLGFSLAVHTDPDLLLVDEVLAVGDAAFVAKCKDRIAQLRKEGKTLFLVTHDLDAVERWCDEAIWLHQGEVRDRGDPRRVIDHYREFLEKGEEAQLQISAADHGQEEDLSQSAEQKSDKARWGSREIEIVSVRLLDRDGKEKVLLHPDDGLKIEIRYSVNETVPKPVFGVCINRNDGVVVLGTNTEIERVNLPVQSEHGVGGVVTYELTRLGLMDGSYTVDVAVHREDGYPYDYHKAVTQFTVRWPLKQLGVIVPEHRWVVGHTGTAGFQPAYDLAGNPLRAGSPRSQ